MNRARALCYLLAPIVIAEVASPEEAAHDQPAVDKGAFHLFNPTPAQYLRELTRDGPGETESPYTVDAGHFQIEMDLVSYTLDKDSSGGRTHRLDAWAIGRMNLKVGLLNQLDAQLVLETYNLIYQRTGNTRVTQRGYGDTTARLKYKDCAV